MVRGMQQRTQNLQLTETDGETVGEVAGREKKIWFPVDIQLEERVSVEIQQEERWAGIGRMYCRERWT
jgi:hypothetical protein